MVECIAKIFVAVISVIGTTSNVCEVECLTKLNAITKRQRLNIVKSFAMKEAGGLYTKREQSIKALASRTKNYTSNNRHLKHQSNALIDEKSDT